MKSRCLVFALAYCILSAGIVNARAADGPFALSFDGVDDYVSSPHNSLLNSYQLTVTAWFKTTQTTGEAGLVNKYFASSFNGWQVFLFNGEVRAWFFANNANYVWDLGRGLNAGFYADGQWHHVAFTVESGGARLYVDGNLRDLRSWTGTPGNASTTQELRLGSYPGSGFYNGLIDEVTVWNRTLSHLEILETMSTSIVDPHIHLRVYHRITEGSGTTTANTAYGRFDSSANLIGGPAWVPGIILKPGVYTEPVGSSRVDLQACKLEYSIVSPK